MAQSRGSIQSLWDQQEEPVRALVAVLLSIAVAPAAAQDTNYWNIQYGTHATLLGGAVIGSVSDLSATYYNPGAVALFDDPRFILSAKVYEQNSLTVENGAGPGADLTSSSISPSPSFVAAALKFKWLHENKLAVSILTRQRMNAEAATRRITTFDVLPGVPGVEDFAGGVSFEQEVEEDWVGVTWARALGPRIGIGVSPYVAYRHQKWRRETIVQVLQGGGELASSTDIRRFEYQNYRLLAKFGLGVDVRPVTFGLTVTTPGGNLHGTGSTGRHTFINGVDLDGNGTPDSYFASNYQEDVPSAYHSPWSVGFGCAYDFGPIVPHASAEWFAAVSRFDVLETSTYIGQSSGDVLSNPLTLELQSVTNFGIGLDYLLGEKSILSGSFITDFSAYQSGTTTNLALSRWDMYHVSGGATFKVASSEITLGLSYAFGSEDIPQPIDISGPADGTSAGTGNNSTFRVRRIKFLFGFNF
jgi:hypothetical protein